MVPNELIDRFLTGLSHDLPTFMTVFTDDIVYFDVPLLAEMKGKEELKNFAVAFFAAFPDVQFTRTSPPVVSGDRAAVTWRVTGTQKGQFLDVPATNKTMDVMGVSMMEFKDGKIARNSDYWDMATLLRQIGHMPASPQ
ncbi:ester cyclase [Burkholderia cenocepacia]|uniref:Ester cyclase n=2 Tax=Burkholderia cenocepacia TaxID=95486 RepID=A0ABD4UJ50_9BURK|nr:ester cyclase [Burkholderia cenocepacia]MCW3662542.1 ester cyclase [Burkholderia cenocepacia]MCW3697909.1 ester cyclase [Burkholderia cenocepacia]MCW3705630.1 ester cyclase [Burkholderia cenocepacia]MCW3714039.1 ester cyclase [Burkholderia cenocepacia]MCW3722069.1 ester cyclase [Burkholderia cenocepacia]